MKSKRTEIKEERFISYLRSLGFLFPETEIELDRFNKLYSNFKHKLTGNEIIPQNIISEVEKVERNQNPIIRNSQKSDSKRYFKRAVLAAEIASQLYDEPTFGHVKFQKLMYLCEHVVHLIIREGYSKQAAGPYDRIFMHTIDYEFKRQRWFNVSQEGSYNKFVYKPLEHVLNYKKYYQKYFSEYDEKIQWLIQTFKSERTEYVELIATLYACLDEALSHKEDSDHSTIIKKFYNWSDEKKKYSRSEVEAALGWMKENSLIPEPSKE